MNGLNDKEVNELKKINLKNQNRNKTKLNKKEILILQRIISLNAQKIKSAKKCINIYKVINYVINKLYNRNETCKERVNIIQKSSRSIFYFLWYKYRINLNECYRLNMKVILC